MHQQDRAARLTVAGEQQTEVAVLAAGCFWESKRFCARHQG